MVAAVPSLQAVSGGPKVERTPMGKGYLQKEFVMTQGNIILKGNIDGPGLGIELNLEAIRKYPPRPWRRGPVFEPDGNIGFI